MTITFDWLQVSVEVHVIHEYKEDFYGKGLKVLVLGAIRGERSFNGIQELATRIGLDVSIARLMALFKPYKSFAKDPFISK